MSWQERVLATLILAVLVFVIGFAILAGLVGIGVLK